MEPKQKSRSKREDHTTKVVGISKSYMISKNKINNTPIIVANTEWKLPKELLKWIQEERMINSLVSIAHPLTPEESVGWAECCGYLNPATNKEVLKSEVSEIYLYCVTQLLKNKKMLDALPNECHCDKLSNYQMQKLNEFKLWIFKTRGGKIKNPIVDALKIVFEEAKLENKNQKFQI